MTSLAREIPANVIQSFSSHLELQLPGVDWSYSPQFTRVGVNPTTAAPLRPLGRVEFTLGTTFPTGVQEQHKRKIKGAVSILCCVVVANGSQNIRLKGYQESFKIVADLEDSFGKGIIPCVSGLNVGRNSILASQVGDVFVSPLTNVTEKEIAGTTYTWADFKIVASFDLEYGIYRNPSTGKHRLTP